MLCSRRQIACDKGNGQKREEDQPEFSGFDTQTWWRKEEIIEKQRSQARRYGGFAKTPSTGYDQDREEQGEDYRCNMHVSYGCAQRNDPRDGTKRNS
jgi:hypothetical protein